MTNLIRRKSVASLLIHGEAWKQLPALRRLTCDRRTACVVEVGMPRWQSEVSGETCRFGEIGRSHSLHSTDAAVRGGKGGKQNRSEGREAGSRRREVTMEPISVWIVPERARHAAEARRNPERGWAEGSIWTDRLVSALATASNEHTANAPSLLMRGSPFALSLSRRDTPDAETNDWRAVCGRTARTVRRAGRRPTSSRPLSNNQMMWLDSFLVNL
jgi:hypothetical protein